MEQAEEQKKKAYDAEMARLDREAKERERQRRIEEHREIQKKHALEKIEQLKKTDIGAKVLQNLDEEVYKLFKITSRVLLECSIIMFLIISYLYLSWY